MDGTPAFRVAFVRKVEKKMSSFAIYTIGFLIFLGGVIWAALAFGLPGQWVAIGAVILGGLGLITAVTNTRSKDETPTSEGEQSGS